MWYLQLSSWRLVFANAQGKNEYARAVYRNNVAAVRTRFLTSRLLRRFARTL